MNRNLVSVDRSDIQALIQALEEGRTADALTIARGMGEQRAPGQSAADPVSDEQLRKEGHGEQQIAEYRLEHRARGPAAAAALLGGMRRGLERARMSKNANGRRA